MCLLLQTKDLACVSRRTLGEVKPVGATHKQDSNREFGRTHMSSVILLILVLMLTLISGTQGQKSVQLLQLSTA